MKKQIETVLGHDNYMRIKGVVKYLRDALYYLKNDKLVLCKDDAILKIYGNPGYHVFFGYYDLQQFNADETRILSHCLPKNAQAGKTDASVGFFNIGDGEYHEVARTAAWSWQQGARLRWWPEDDNYISYNIYEEGLYRCVKVDVDTGLTVKKFPRALYDIDGNGNFGLSLNFARLQRLRPGYGYSNIPDDSINETRSSNDGIFYVDLHTNKESLLVGLDRLAKGVLSQKNSHHYINHISIAPDNSKFMFFHIWTINEKPFWKTRLMVFDIKTNNLIELESEDQVSHYDWVDNDRIIVTAYTQDRSQYYCVFDTKNGSKTILNEKILNLDGHPSILSDINNFITDTYPKEHDLQRLYLYKMNEHKAIDLLKVYSSPLMYKEKRCDLHPRVSTSENFIVIDSTFQGNVRKMIMISNWKGR